MVWVIFNPHASSDVYVELPAVTFPFSGIVTLNLTFTVGQGAAPLPDPGPPLVPPGPSGGGGGGRVKMHLLAHC